MPFAKGHDSNRSNGRTNGAIGHSTIAMQAEFRKAFAPNLHKYFHILDGLTKPTVDGEKCPLCEQGWPRKETTILKALEMLMDRSGLHPKVEVEITEQPDIAWMQYLSDERLTTIKQWMLEAKEQVPNTVIDAEIIGESHQLEGANV